MNGRSEPGSFHVRTQLRDNWSVCAVSPQDADIATPPADAVWTPIATLAPAAAALRALNRWSIDDPAKRFDAEDWWYRLELDAPDVAAGTRLVLGMDGLATVSQVWLNGEVLLSSRNMFIAHACEVTEKLQPGRNVVLMRFAALDTQLAARRKRPRWRAPMIENQQLRWFRTTLLGRTPGWSPPAAVVGPWKDVWLEQRQFFSINQTALRARVDGSTGVLSCELDLALLGGAAVEAVVLQLDGHSQPVTQVLSGSTDHFSGTLQVADVVRWWPHTHGEPALYSASVSVRLAGVAQPVCIALGQVGFRTIALDTSNGEFSLSVNGVPVFCRGACWTPLDPVTLRSSASDCLAAVQQVREAGMNMLRVTGTMVYEEDHFFDACDQQGILVWQDFMFANMDYPSDDAEFMQSVDTEVRQQLGRLQGRACLAVLCGNSEVAQQAAMWGAARALWHSPLFEQTLAELCSTLAPDTAYWPSSAHGGAFPHQGDVGTTSYYGVGAYLRGFDDARRSGLKFATECLAFANIPVDGTLERMPGGLATRAHHPGWKARSPRDLGAGWDFDDVRDHYVSDIFATDPHKLRYSEHDRYLTLGRAATGETMARAFTEWRRPASSCRGALVLYLRDLWAGAGWGLLDDAGNPKACFHYLKRTLQPVSVALTDEGGNGLFVHLVNESASSKPLELEIRAWRAGDVLVAEGKQALDLPAHTARSLPALEVFGHFMDLTHAYRFGPMACDVVVATLRNADGQLVSQAFYFPGGLSAQRERDVGLRVQSTWIDAQTAELTLQTRCLAQAVHFDLPGFVADDEFFHMAPHSDKRVVLRSRRPRALMGVVRAVNSTADTQISLAAC